MVDVSSQNNSVSINVSSSGNSASIKATPDTALYYSEKSREWAISDRIVDGKDYSSKYYANKSAISESNAKGYAQSSQDTYNQFQQSVEGALSNVDIAVQGAVESINTKSVEAIDNINSTKTNIINDIEFVADGEKEEIRDIIDTGKDELKESIGDIKFLTTLEIGDIGIAPLGIDESKGKRRYLNGQLIIQEQYVQFANKVKSAVALYPSLACTELEWQTTATMTVGGQVGKFVVDDEGGTIRLPKIIMPIQGLTDLSKLAEIVEAGLPNITGTINQYFTAGGGDADGSFLLKNYTSYYAVSGGKNQGLNTLTFDASRSSSIYGNSNTVQQEQIQYPYFIQVATGAEVEDNIINEIELNNPFSLLDYKYSEYELNNLSWLRSNGQYNSKAIYPAVYDLLLKIYNGTETKDGVSVKLSTEAYEDTDFVINTADTTFRLPIRTKDDFVVEEYNNGTEWYRVYKSGWVEQGGVEKKKQATTRSVSFAKNFSNTSYSVLLTYQSSDGDLSNGAITARTKNVNSFNFFAWSDDEVCWRACGQGAEIPQSKTYFYVGETVQNANLINAGRIEEKIADISAKVENVIPNNKALIDEYSTSAIMPDYTTAVSVTTKTYTAPYKGWLVGLCATSGSTTSTGYINNVLISQEYGDYQNIQILMDAGDVFTTGASEVKLNFCALKGANQ